MFWERIGICLLLFIVHDSYQISTKDSPSYIAAVVEFSPSYVKDNASETLKKNAEAYVAHIKKASQQNADIIVFPEDGLTTLHLPQKSLMNSWSTLIPSVSDNYIPCTQNSINVSDTLRLLSCAARENQIYVVVNIAEKYLPGTCQEEECQAAEKYYHNSNVVFDRTGKIIARYRKFNLYGEPQFDITKVPEVITFDTDFGVTFGTFICFDILFKEPALNLTRIAGATDIVYPTAWFSELPFLTAVQTQFGWSYGENVNLLAAGYSRPQYGSTGSGIYLGRNGIATAVMLNVAEDRLLIAVVPKVKKGSPEIKVPSSPIKNVVLNVKEDEQKERPESLHLMHENIANFESKLFNGTFIDTVCQGDFCCKFHIKATETVDSTIKYRVVVFDGVRSYGGVVEAGVRVCGLIQCSNDSIISCSSIADTNITFTTLEITGTFDKNFLIMPTTVNSAVLPFENWTYQEQIDEDQVNIYMSLSSPVNNLASFGIYSREFSKDQRRNAAPFVTGTGVLLVSSLMFFHFLY